VRVLHRIALLVAALLSDEAAAAPVEAVDVKTALVGKIIEFVRWPKGQGSDPPPLVIAVYGNSPLIDRIAEVYSRRELRARAVIVRQAASIEELAGADVILLGAIDRAARQNVLSWARLRPILTMTDCDGCGQEGAGVNFVIRESRVRFEINPTSLKDAGLTASYRLFAVANVIEEKGARR
jgi:hypothetical protein